MSNPAFMSVCFEGQKKELKSLYGKMKRLQEREKPLVENSFYYPQRWLGNLVTRLGGNWHKVYCRGEWSELELTENYLYFFTETAWQPPFRLLKLIQEVYPSLTFYFSAEGDDWDAYLTNDKDGRYFTSRFVLDMEPDIEYFDTIEEASNHLAAYIGKPIEANWQALWNAAEEWNDDHPDADWYINVKQFEIITNDELWDVYL
jgi:hypothetical protein